jgi:hypothetical protein
MRTTPRKILVLWWKIVGTGKNHSSTACGHIVKKMKPLINDADCRPLTALLAKLLYGELRVPKIPN